jgi:hypothetical protein
MPLVKGKYPTNSVVAALLGSTTNATQPNIPARSNLEWPGVGTITDGDIATTGVFTAVAVPVDVGTTISTISVYVGATAASTPTHSAGAIYAGTVSTGTPAILGKSADGTTAAIGASGILTFTLATPVVITSAMAPYGYIYAGFTVTSSTQPTVASLGTPTAVTYAWYTNSPLLAGTSGSSLAGVPAATLSLTAKAVAPVIVLA